MKLDDINPTNLWFPNSAPEEEFRGLGLRYMGSDLRLPWRLNGLDIVDADGKVITTLTGLDIPLFTTESQSINANDFIDRINSGTCRVQMWEDGKSQIRPDVPLYASNIGQKIKEIDALIDLVKTERVQSLLEVGSAYGGSLWKISRSMPKGSRVVSVDLPMDDITSKSVMDCAASLQAEGYEVKLLQGDSTDDKLIDQVRALAPFDLVFIDANHTMPFVELDWQNYGSLGRMVAFHDIAWPYVEAGMAVSHLWDRIKLSHRHEEFIERSGEFGIGVLWR